MADSGEPEAFETYFPPMDKHFRISVVSPERGQFATLATDITAQKRSEEALLRSDLGLRAAQRVAQVGSWVWHLQTGKVEWSDEMYRIFGVEKEGFSGNLGEVVARAIHPEDQAEVLRANRLVLEEGRPQPLEYRICLPDGRDAHGLGGGGRAEAGSGRPPGAALGHRHGHHRAQAGRGASGPGWRPSCARPRRWSRSAGWPAASPTTSTTC